MKINRLLSAALITIATVFTGCVKESVWDVKTGIDSSKAAPEGFTYDEAMSSKNTLTVYWDGQSAKAAGAKSFLVQLTDAENMDKGNTWDTKVTKVLEITDDETANYESATFSGLTEYTCYYVRVRANYPGSVYSEWVYINKADGTPALMQVGHGEVGLVPVVTLNALVSDIEVNWTLCEGATKYVVEYKKSTDSSWKSIETTETSCTISGLDDLTTYEVKVTSVTANQSYASDVVKATTKERPPFPMDINTADEWLKFVNGENVALAVETDVVTLKADLDFSGKEYATAAEFKGIVEGNGKTIKNLNASTPLFKSVNQVKDLTIDASCSFATTTAHVFASVAETATGAITNVVNKASVTATLGDVSESYVVGGIVAYAYGNLVDCTNEGAVKITALTANGGGLGGIVGYTEAEVNNSTNKGTVTGEFGVLGTKLQLGAIEAAAPGVGGVVGHAQGEFAMTNSNNEGDVTYTVKDITVSAGFNRTQVGGIVGAPNGVLTRCTNKGNVNINHTLPSRAAYTAAEHIICIGGIGGGDYHATKRGDGVAQGTTSYINCVNEGNVTVDSDAAKSNNAIGGIVGWPGAENGNVTNKTEGCINRGKVTLKGNAKGRVGGIQGGTGHIIKCENRGEVRLESSASNACALGSVAGFHSQNHKISESCAYGDVTALVGVVGIGGLIGNNGNAKNTSGEGCIIDCNINGGTEEIAGMVVGFWNGTSNAVTLGSAESPIQVSGTCNGAPASASNLCGTKNATSAHVINAVIK